jgi:hypothetical protein
MELKQDLAIGYFNLSAGVKLGIIEISSLFRRISENGNVFRSAPEDSLS